MVCPQERMRFRAIAYILGDPCLKQDTNAPGEITTAAQARTSWSSTCQ